MNDFDKDVAPSFACGGRSVGYVVRPSRGRSLRIVVRGADDVELRVPARVSTKAAQAFLEEHAAWIMRAMERQAKKSRRAAHTYSSGDVFFFLGKPCRLEVVRSVWKSVRHEDDVLRVSLYNETDARRVKELVETWFFKQAQTRLEHWLADAVARYGGRIRHASTPVVMRSAANPEGLRLTVRAMKTRWGSCSKEGHVTLSAELVHVPHRLAEYVIVHELCHLAHLNHSRAFYFQLAQCLPDWKERRKELETRAWQEKEHAG